MSQVKYTGGGGDNPHTAPFPVRFKQSVPKFEIEEGEESKMFVIKMVKLPGIMVYTPYGVKHYFRTFQTEEEILDEMEFLESNPS